MIVGHDGAMTVLEQALRWEESGGEWRILADLGDRVRVGLFTCTGEQMDQLEAGPDERDELLSRAAGTAR